MRGPQWSSPDARRAWAPTLTAARNAWAEIELAGVAAGTSFVSSTSSVLVSAGASVGFLASTLKFCAGMFPLLTIPVPHAPEAHPPVAHAPVAQGLHAGLLQTVV